MNLRLDDLQIKNYYIYQDTDSFCFGVDAVLLANFMAKFIKRNDKVIDLCAGNGIIPILIYAKKDKNSNLFLLKAVKNAKESMKILPPLTMYENNNQYTKEFMEYYYEDRTSKQ